MIKVETEKKMNLVELIQWAFDNNIIDKTYLSDNDSYIHFNEYGDVTNVLPVGKNDFFTVEVEEKITENTIFPLLLKIYETAENIADVSVFRSKSINMVETSTKTIAYYLINNDGTLTLIWKDGELE